MASEVSDDIDYSLFGFHPRDIVDGEEPPPGLVTESLRLSLLYGAGTVLVRYLLDQESKQDQEQVEVGGWAAIPGRRPVSPSKAVLQVLMVEESAEASRMLREFRAAQWALVASLWRRLRWQWPAIADRASVLLGDTSGCPESEKRIIYLGMGAQERAATFPASECVAPVPGSAIREPMLLRLLSEICTADLRQSAAAAAKTAVLVAQRSGFMDVADVEQWQESILTDLCPLRVSAQFAPVTPTASAPKRRTGKRMPPEGQ